ncbi:MAG: hypothetical protein QOC81_3017 [Thermoanaerobaculia bacterium]|jgi:asparagine synthase (glutamine-hydrolysing)|nr:hypothetical protein [Thermoanaerobaculia bacterium]
MRSFAGVVQEKGSEPGVALLQHLGATIRLPASSSPVIARDQSWGVAAVAHLSTNAAALIERDGNASLAGNIRLDDRASLARELGDSPPNANDYELTLRAWRRWGSSFVDHLFGDYSFVIWDGDAHELLCVRDRFGVRPFFYAQTKYGLTFSDSLAAILAHPETEADSLDDGAVADYLLHGVSNDAAATIYKNVRRVPPGHMLVFHPGGDVSVRAYWQPREAGNEPLRDDAAPHLERALEEAISDRVAPSASAVIFMSGGLDSTTLAALAHESIPRLQITAATTVYRTRIPDEEERYAVEAARSIGIPLHCFPLDDYGPLRALDEGLWMPEPGPLLMAPMTRDLYSFAASIAPAALHGHPADALLIAEMIPFLMRLLRRGELVRFASALIRYTAVRRRPPYFLLRHLLRRSSGAPYPTALPDWLNPSFAQRLRGRSLAVEAESEGLRPHTIDALRSAIWSSYFEWAHPLMTGAAIEVHYPFCDQHVTDVLLSVEPIPALIGKHVLREILRGRVSETIRRRRKRNLQGDPWTMDLGDRDISIDAAAPYIDAVRFRAACRDAGSLAGSALRAVALDYWLRNRPSHARSIAARMP